MVDQLLQSEAAAENYSAALTDFQPARRLQRKIPKHAHDRLAPAGSHQQHVALL
jgi:hypothetical protein